MKHVFENGDNLWFTSDTHFRHENILLYANRPFLSIQEHDERLIENWNKVVSKDDYVFHLGDFSFGYNIDIPSIVNRLNGKIILIIGNHDWTSTLQDVNNVKLFESVSQQMSIRVGNTTILMNHYPFLCYAGTYNKGYKTWQLFGHVHSKNGECYGADAPRLNMLFPTQYDVGVDNNNYTPVSFNTIKDKIRQQIEKSINNPE